MRAHPLAQCPVRTACFLGAVVAFAAVTPRSAPAQAPRLTVIGVGAGVSCAEWLATGRSDPELEHWAFGFASAVAATARFQRGGDQLARMEADAIHARLGDRCKSRPEDAWSVALTRMVLSAPP